MVWVLSQLMAKTDWLCLVDMMEELTYIHTNKWETTDIKLNRPKKRFGSLTVKIADIVSKFL